MDDKVIGIGKSSDFNKLNEGLLNNDNDNNNDNNTDNYELINDDVNNDNGNGNNDINNNNDDINNNDKNDNKVNCIDRTDGNNSNLKKPLSLFSSVPVLDRIMNPTKPQSMIIGQERIRFIHDNSNLKKPLSLFSSVPVLDRIMNPTKLQSMIIGQERIRFIHDNSNLKKPLSLFSSVSEPYCTPKPPLPHCKDNNDPDIIPPGNTNIRYSGEINDSGSNENSDVKKTFVASSVLEPKCFSIYRDNHENDDIDDCDENDNNDGDDGDTNGTNDDNDNDKNDNRDNDNDSDYNDKNDTDSKNDEKLMQKNLLSPNHEKEKEQPKESLIEKYDRMKNEQIDKEVKYEKNKRKKARKRERKEAARIHDNDNENNDNNDDDNSSSHNNSDNHNINHEKLEAKKSRKKVKLIDDDFMNSESNINNNPCNYWNRKSCDYEEKTKRPCKFSDNHISGKNTFRYPFDLKVQPHQRSNGIHTSNNNNSHNYYDHNYNIGVDNNTMCYQNDSSIFNYNQVDPTGTFVYPTPGYPDTRYPDTQHPDIQTPGYPDTRLQTPRYPDSRHLGTTTLHNGYSNYAFTMLNNHNNSNIDYNEMMNATRLAEHHQYHASHINFGYPNLSPDYRVQQYQNDSYQNMNFNYSSSQPSSQPSLQPSNDPNNHLHERNSSNNRAHRNGKRRINK
jgi:hypothetical protein